MKGATLLSIAAFVCGLAGVSEATTCTEDTLFTCKETLYVTGECVDEVCQCISPDYKPGPYGCQETLKAEITAHFNGTVQTNASIQLNCTIGFGEDTYEWFKDGSLISNEIDSVLNFKSADPSMNGDYTCKSSIAGVLSEASDPFTINVLDDLTAKPEVIGMPTAVAENTTIKFTCFMGPKYDSTTYTWILDGVTLSDNEQIYLHKVTSENAGKNLKCLIGLESDAVTFPDSIASDIHGVEIHPISSTNLIKTNTLKLRCNQTGGFPEPDETDTLITYEWKRDSTPLGKKDVVLDLQWVKEENSGSYTCEATAGSNAAKSSAPVNVTVEKFMEFVYTNNRQALKNGYTSLHCDYKTANTLLSVSYKWFKNDVELRGVTDKILQLNHATSDLDGIYNCHAISDEGTLIGYDFSIRATDSSGITSHWHNVGKPEKIAAGTNLTFTCKNMYYYTPGATIVWKVNDTLQEGEDSETFIYNPQSTDSVDIACGYIFDGYTNVRSTTIDPKYIFSVTIKVNDYAVQILKPVEGTKVKLTCDVDKSEGAGTVTYTWKDGSTVLEGETSEHYEMVAGEADSTPLSITCEATANFVTVASVAVLVVPGASVETPHVIIGDNLKREGAIDLFCRGESLAEGATFQWFKNDTLINGITSYKYTIKEAAETDDGDYTCKMTIAGATSETSGAGTLTTTANEFSCDWASDCKEANNMNSTVCEDGKCNCLPGYEMKGGVCCEGGVCCQGEDCSGTVCVMGSLLVIVCAVLTQMIL